MADTLQALVIAVIKGPLEQRQQPGTVRRHEPGLPELFLEELGGIRHLQEKLVEVAHQLIGVGFNEGQKASQGLHFRLGEPIVVLDFLERVHGCLSVGNSPD